MEPAVAKGSGNARKQHQKNCLQRGILASRVDWALSVLNTYSTKAGEKFWCFVKSERCILCGCFPQCTRRFSADQLCMDRHPLFQGYMRWDMMKRWHWVQSQLQLYTWGCPQCSSTWTTSKQCPTSGALHNSKHQQHFMRTLCLIAYFKRGNQFHWNWLWGTDKMFEHSVHYDQALIKSSVARLVWLVIILNRKE